MSGSRRSRDLSAYKVVTSLLPHVRGPARVRALSSRTYGFTSAASSARIYWENKSGTFAGPRLTLPVAATVLPKDIPLVPRSWIEDTYSNLIHYGEANKGGHFAALEQPGILVSEIRTGLRTLRT
jgi:epoxide hydrolase